MKKPTTQLDSATEAPETSPQLFDDWFDPIEVGVRSRVRDFIETMMEEELDAVLSRPRYGRIAPGAVKEEAGTAEVVFARRAPPLDAADPLNGLHGYEAYAPIFHGPSGLSSQNAAPFLSF